MEAELWGFPSFFSETHCLTANEAQASGTPIVTTNLAALSTTVGSSGILLEGDSRAEYYQENFINACVKILKTKDLWNDLSKRGLEKVKEYSWDKIIKEWISEL